jgi:hypothetical protein
MNMKYINILRLCYHRNGTFKLLFIYFILFQRDMKNVISHYPLEQWEYSRTSGGI